MDKTELAIRLEAEFPKAVVAGDKDPVQAVVAAGDIRPFLKAVKEKLGLDYLMFMTAVDKPVDKIIEAVYMLCSENRTPFTVKVALSRTHPEIASVADIYRTAEWHEREAAEMFGITFTGHPDPRKLLLPDDFTGHPLLKDFKDDFLQPLPTGKKEE